MPPESPKEMDANPTLEEIIKKHDEEIDPHFFTMAISEPLTHKKHAETNQEKYTKWALRGALLAALWAHFIWATIYFVQVTDSLVNETLCSGYGFLVILFAFVNFGVAFRVLVSPYLLPIFRKFVWDPAARLLAKIKYGPVIFYVAVFGAFLAILINDSVHDEWTRLIPLVGLGAYLLACFAISSNRSKIPWHTVCWGLILQFVFGLLTIRWDTGRNIFDCIGQKVNTFLDYAVEGSAFVYGDQLVNVFGVFAFKSLATIYFLGFIINMLYYYGIMQKIVGGIGNFLQWVMGTSICESVNSAANIFLGQTEAPLLLKPYLTHLTDSELHSVMTSGFATVSGTVLAAYISYGANAAHLITSSVMSAPAALCISKIIYPETEEIIATKEKIQEVEVEYESALDAASKGAHDAAHIVMAIIANLVAFVAFVAFVNGVLSWFGQLVGYGDDGDLWTVDLILGKIFIPISYIMGVPWDECEKVGQLIGLKTMVNEFVAFERMGQMDLTPKTKIIATYSICGFANPGSIGLVISAMATLIPDKREAITRLVFRAFIGGCVTCFMTACIAAMLTPVEI